MVVAILLSCMPGMVLATENNENEDSTLVSGYVSVSGALPEGATLDAAMIKDPFKTSAGPAKVNSVCWRLWSSGFCPQRCPGPGTTQVFRGNCGEIPFSIAACARACRDQAGG